MSQTDNIVREQYEALPYPPRDPRDERKRLVAPMIDCLDVLNYRGFGGDRDLRAGGRILVAGGGTGDSVIFLAEQLRDTPTEIVYLDISAASMQVAQQRAAERNLHNIQWQHGSLLELNPEKNGQFDYINCSGVLHHLEHPSDGLAVLSELLLPDGCIGLMLYGRHARAGVYQMQALLRLLNTDTASRGERIANARRLLSGAPKENWFKRSEDMFNDHRLGDAGLYDLLLHERDQAFSVPEISQLLSVQGLALQSFAEPHLYRISNYCNDKELIDRFAQLTELEQAAAAELLCGSLKTHIFYARHHAVPPPMLSDESLIPSLPISSDPSGYQTWANVVAARAGEGSITIRVDGQIMKVQISPALIPALRYFDGRTTIADVIRKSGIRAKQPAMEIRKAFISFCLQLERRGALFLRSENISGFSHVADLHQNIAQS